MNATNHQLEQTGADHGLPGCDFCDYSTFVLRLLIWTVTLCFPQTLQIMQSLIEVIFPSRLHRLAYFLRGVTTDILAGFIYAFGGTNVSNVWLVLLFLALGVYQLFFIILPRIRDIGMGSW